MRVAVIGSRNIELDDISKYIPSSITMLVSGGARGVDSCAEKFADENQIPKLIILPDYLNYDKSAPIIRNKEIVNKADVVVAIWDGASKGTKYTIDYAKKQGKEVIVYTV